MTTDADRLYLEDVAELCGISYVNARNYASQAERDGPKSCGFPKRDGQEIQGHIVRPWWLRSSIDAWMAQRPGRGNWRTKAAAA